MNEETNNPKTGEGERLEPRREVVEDAVLMLEYAIERGLVVDTAIIQPIRNADRIQVKKADSAPSDWADFDVAYGKLARKLSPITARSLRATEISTKDGKEVARSEAQRWSATLWKFTIGLLVGVVLIEAIDGLTGMLLPINPNTDAELFGNSASFVGVLTTLLGMAAPFVYGGLGACAFLLRRLHQTIHRRTYDPYRKCEYKNRILLGVVAGGAIGLVLGETLTGMIEQEIGLAALAFIAGYNTDFLFTAVERIVAAVLPKVEAQRAGALPEDYTPPKPPPVEEEGAQK